MQSTPAQPAPAPPPAVEPALAATTRPPSPPQNARWREVATPAQPIGSVLQRSRRKSTGLTINNDGLQVNAPNRLPLRHIEDAAVATPHETTGRARRRGYGCPEGNVVGVD